MKEEPTLGGAHDTGGIRASTSTIVVTALALWVAAALAVGGSGVLEDPPNPLPVAFIWGPVLIFLVVFVRSRTFRAWTLDINLRWLILYSVVRVVVGVGFLLMSGRELPSEFAVPAGLGDVAVGTASLFAALFVPISTVTRRRVVFGWNLVGLLDMLMVFVTAQRLLLFGDDPNALVELTKFPLFVVPTFVVPLVLITHFVIFAQLWHNREPEAP